MRAAELTLSSGARLLAWCSKASVDTHMEADPSGRGLVAVLEAARRARASTHAAAARGADGCNGQSEVEAARSVIDTLLRAAPGALATMTSPNAPVTMTSPNALATMISAIEIKPLSTAATAPPPVLAASSSTSDNPPADGPRVMLWLRARKSKVQVAVTQRVYTLGGQAYTLERAAPSPYSCRAFFARSASGGSFVLKLATSDRGGTTELCNEVTLQQAAGALVAGGALPEVAIPRVVSVRKHPSGGLIAYAMDPLPGLLLQDFLRRAHPPHDTPEVWAAVREDHAVCGVVLNRLSRLSALGAPYKLMHRDLTDANVLIAPPRDDPSAALRVGVIDFEKAFIHHAEDGPLSAGMPGVFAYNGTADLVRFVMSVQRSLVAVYDADGPAPEGFLVRAIPFAALFASFLEHAKQLVPDAAANARIPSPPSRPGGEPLAGIGNSWADFVRADLRKQRVLTTAYYRVQERARWYAPLLPGSSAFLQPAEQTVADSPLPPPRALSDPERESLAAEDASDCVTLPDAISSVVALRGMLRDFTFMPPALVCVADVPHTDHGTVVTRHKEAHGSEEAARRIMNMVALQHARLAWVRRHPDKFVNMLRCEGFDDEDIQVRCSHSRKSIVRPSEAVAKPLCLATRACRHAIIVHRCAWTCASR